MKREGDEELTRMSQCVVRGEMKVNWNETGNGKGTERESKARTERRVTFNGHVSTSIDRRKILADQNAVGRNSKLALEESRASPLLGEPNGATNLYK